MAVDLEGTYDEQAEPDAGRGPLPAGQYVARIVDAKREPVSKTKDCGSCLVLTWKVEGGEADSRLFWQRLNLWFNGTNEEKVREIANAQFAAIRQATGVITPRDTDELLERPCAVTLSVKQSEGYNPRNEVTAVKPVGEARAAPPAAARPAPAAQQSGGNVFSRAKAAAAG